MQIVQNGEVIGIQSVFAGSETDGCHIQVVAYLLNIGRFYGSSYFADPRGQIVAQASEDQDELLVAELDLDLVREVRNTWQFFRDRRPETYGQLTEL